jgi:hypothetical protein
VSSDARLRRLEAKRRTLAPTAEEAEERRETGFRGMTIIFVKDDPEWNEVLGYPPDALLGDVDAIRAAKEAVRHGGIGIAYPPDDPARLQPIPPELLGCEEQAASHHGDGTA